MTVGLGCALDGNGGHCKFTFKESLVEQVEQLVQIAGCPVVGGQLLHSETPFVSIKLMGIYEKRPARTQSDRSNREGLIYIFEVGFLDLISQSWYRSGEKK